MPSAFHSTAKILFYGDSSETNLIAVSPDGKLRRQEGEFGLRILKDTLEAFFPQTTVDLVNRFWILDADGRIPRNTERRKEPARLTPELLRKYDEIWFFGQHLGSFNPGDPPGAGKDANGYPESDLDANELTALAAWMNAGGGVLILGDRSNPVVDQSVPPVNLLWNLGRALGGSVLRAGKMRVWDGPPGAYRAEGQVNTSGDTDDMIVMPNQEDNVPQAIFPVFWDVRIGLSFERHWHSLFVGPTSDSNPFGIIRIMADHGHEGALVQPTRLEPPEWPTAPGGYQPKPVVVAHGTNMDTGERVPLVSAYDGHPAGVGRIVAHTTWHHFVNVNLHGFLLPDGSPDESLQTLGQYFNNLVWYLMPHRQKDGTLGSALEWLTDSAIIRDLRGAPLGILGHAAYVVLNEVASRGQIQDLLHQAVEAALPPTQDNATSQLPLPPLPYLLGALVAERQDFHRNAGKHDYESTGTRSLVARGIKRALWTHLKEHQANIEAVEGLLYRCE